MVASLVGLILLAYSVAVLMTCFSVWLYVFVRRGNNQPILEQQPIRRSLVGATDIAAVATFILVGILLLLNTIGFLVMLFGDAPERDISVSSIWGQMIVQVIISVILAITIVARGGGSMFLGETWDQFLRDARIGVLAFCALCVPVIVIQAVTALLTPYEHPLIQVMIDDPQWNILIPVLISAVLVAPLTEEFFFRLVMQGWLEDFFGIRLARVSAEENAPSDDTFEGEVEMVVAALDEPMPHSIEHSELADASDYHGTQHDSAEPADPTEWITPPYQPVPIVFTSLLFSMMHLGQGAAPIPLFFLALGLGYVFQRTRTMTASLVVHFLLNGQSMLLLLVQIFLGDSLGTPPI